MYHAVTGTLAGATLDQFVQRVLQAMPRFVAQPLARPGDAGDAMPDVAAPRLAKHLRLQVRSPHGTGQQTGYGLHGVVASASEVDHSAGPARPLHRAYATPG